MAQISIVIVSWNTSGLLAGCLQSIEQAMVDFPAGNVQTIVVDNASQDGSAEMVRRCFPWVCLVENQENIGFASGNNQAFPVCTGDYVWLLNPDTVLRPGALPALVEFMNAHPSVGAAGSCLIDSDGSLQVSCSPAPTLARELWYLFHLDQVYPYAEYTLSSWRQDVSRQVDTVQGASMMVRRQVLEQIGGFDTAYFMYSEEVDLCQRIRSAGWQIHWVPQSKVVHYGGQSTQQVATAMFLQLYRSKVMYFEKHQGWLAAQL
jgi:GT2 family glycosyltransferase